MEVEKVEALEQELVQELAMVLVEEQELMQELAGKHHCCSHKGTLYFPQLFHAHLNKNTRL